MTTKKRDASLAALEKGLTEQVTHSETMKADTNTPVVTEAPRRKKKLQPIPVYAPLQVHEQLRKLSFEERKSMSTLLLEGVDLLFKKKGLRSIKELRGEQ